MQCKLFFLSYADCGYTSLAQFSWIYNAILLSFLIKRAFLIYFCYILQTIFGIVFCLCYKFFIFVVMFRIDINIKFHFVKWGNLKFYTMKLWVYLYTLMVFFTLEPMAHWTKNLSCPVVFLSYIFRMIINSHWKYVWWNFSSITIYSDHLKLYFYTFLDY